MTMVNIRGVIFLLNHSSPIILKAKLSFLETYTSARISTLIHLKPSVREEILGIRGSLCSPGNLNHLEDGRGPTVPLENISGGWRLGDLKAKAPCKRSAHYRCYNIWLLEAEHLKYTFKFPHSSFSSAKIKMASVHPAFQPQYHAWGVNVGLWDVLHNLFPSSSLIGSWSQAIL